MARPGTTGLRWGSVRVGALALAAGCTLELQPGARADGFDQGVMDLGRADAGVPDWVPPEAVAAYRFDDPDQGLLDRTGLRPTLDLEVEGAQFLAEGGLRFDGIDDGAMSSTTADRLIQAIAASQEVTLEVWGRSEQTDQGGPARLVSLSNDPVDVNFMLSQGAQECVGDPGPFHHVRLRARGGRADGCPPLPLIESRHDLTLQHMVVTHTRGGTTSLWVNGVFVSSEDRGPIADAWTRAFLHLGREGSPQTGPVRRPWRGVLLQVIFWDRALTGNEIFDRFDAGPPLP